LGFFGSEPPDAGGTGLAVRGVSSSLGTPSLLIPLPHAGRGANLFRVALQATLAILAIALTGCRRKSEPLPDLFEASAPPPTMSALLPVDAGPSPAVLAQRQKDLAQAKAWLADLQLLVSIQATTSPKQQSDTGDAVSICDAVKAARAKTTDAEIAATLDPSVDLCGFDIPLVVANESLDQLRGSRSQASVRLMCGVSAREIAKAKAVRPTDPKVRAAEAKRRSIGRCQ
jgi:hypothetical protein